MIKDRPDLAHRVYRHGERYLQVIAGLEWRDEPASCNLMLGEGSLDWPEADFNRIELWQMTDDAGLAAPRGYPIENLEAIPLLLAQMASDLKEQALDFLKGDLGRFHRIRAESVQTRPPYMIGEPDESGEYKWEVDQETVALIERFGRNQET